MHLKCIIFPYCNREFGLKTFVFKILKVPSSIDEIQKAKYEVDHKKLTIFYRTTSFFIIGLKVSIKIDCRNVLCRLFCICILFIPLLRQTTETFCHSILKTDHSLANLQSRHATNEILQQQRGNVRTYWIKYRVGSTSFLFFFLLS